MAPPTAASNPDHYFSSPSAPSSSRQSMSDGRSTPATPADPQLVRSLAPSAEFTVPAPSCTAPSDAAAGSPAPAAGHSLSRAASVATSSPGARRNRLSLSFPVVPAGLDLPPSRHRSPITPSASGASTPPAMAIATSTPDDSVAFLTALAAQERRVLELREDLQKAESELEQLKRQWMMHEATKKRREMASEMSGSYNHSQELREALLSPTRREEFERLQQIRNGHENPRRKVLPSQRHQRTLSLLSPDRGRFNQPFPQPEDVDSPARRMAPPPLMKRHTVMNPSMPSRGEASHNPRALSLDTQDLESRHRRKGQEVLLQTGKQIADDFKEGLWTFIEDLKQATVGDDSMYHQQGGTRRIPSGNSLRAETDKARNPHPSTPPNSKGKQREETESASSIADRRASNSSTSSSSYSDAQSYRWSTSTTLSEPGVMTPHTQASTPRTSMSSMTSPLNQHKHSDSISSTTSSKSTASQPNHIWGALASSTAFMTPAQFKKHANALMTQVEKSLSLPPVPPNELAAASSASKADTGASSSSTAVKRPALTRSHSTSTHRPETNSGHSELRARSRAGTAARSDGNA